LQQSWVWFEGSQGIEPQHCMLCGFGVIAAMQSANGKNNTATTANTTNMLFRIISSDSMNIRRFKSRKRCKNLWSQSRAALGRLTENSGEAGQDEMSVRRIDFRRRYGVSRV